MRRLLAIATTALAVTLIAGCGSSMAGTGNSSSVASSSATAVAPTGSSAMAAPASSPDLVTASPAAAAPSLQGVAPTPASAGQSLPLSQSTGSATQVITVVAPSTSSTTATLQAWDKTATGWTAHGAAIAAHVGSAGLSEHTSEGLSKTPIGSFTLTQAFGALANPGTPLSYHKTAAADWWISQPGPLYNTMQTCSGSCSFTQGDPNEHLFYETPYYNYAVVIDYNTSPVVQGAGSAFFLHVTDGKPTAGCVAIPQPNLVAIMQWLNPAAQPRILIGIG